MMTFSDWAGHWLNLPLVIYRDMMRGDVQNNDEVKSKDPTAPVRGDQIRVENKLYSTEKLANLHPGGPLFIKAFSGRDASQAFISYHRRNFPHGRTKSAFEGIDETVNYTPDDHSDFMELCERVNKVLPRLKSFAPWHYYIKAAYLICAFHAMEFYCNYNSFYNIPMALIMGFHVALIGLNIQHDANHGAISKNPWVNRILGLTENMIGGSQVNWIHQHVVQHHLHTNDVHLDPDMQVYFFTKSDVRINPLNALKQHHVGQHVAIWILLPLYGIYVILESIWDLIKGAHWTPYSPLVKKERMFDLFCEALFIFRSVVIPIYRTGTLSVLFNFTLPLFMTGGSYLAFFFMISHNFEGAHALTDTTRPSNKGGEKNSFLYKQVVPSSNVGGWFLCHLHGGLNYQIEHHLFPGMNHCHYPTIAPIVRQFCEEKNIPYRHFPTIMDNWKSSVAHFFDMGHNKNPAMKMTLT